MFIWRSACVGSSDLRIVCISSLPPLQVRLRLQNPSSVYCTVALTQLVCLHCETHFDPLPVTASFQLTPQVSELQLIDCERATVITHTKRYYYSRRLKDDTSDER
jgi:hypothetical protein